jgi:hypothetical protein
MPTGQPRIVKPGQVFNRWKLLEPDLSTTGREPRWRVRCQCGTIRSVILRNIAEGRSKSCGCHKLEVSSQNSRRHSARLVKLKATHGQECTVCRERKPLTEFKRDKNRNSGRSKICRPCDVTMQKERRLEYRKTVPPKPNWKKLTEDFAGQRFGSLTVIREVDKLGEKRAFLCQCDCGTEKVIRLGSLRRGDAKSCGCLAPKFTQAALAAREAKKQQAPWAQ